MVYLLRSLLFVPANSWRMLNRCLTEDADAVILDLEDAVPISDKETARWFIKEFLQKISHTRKYPLIIVRINSWKTGLTVDDLKFSISNNLDAVMLPKCETVDEVKKLEEYLRELEDKNRLENGSIKIIPLIETAKGIENAYKIASASKRIISLAFGAGDYLRDLRLSYIRLSKDQNEILYARSRIVVAAASIGIIPIDTPYLGLIIDREGLKKECLIAKRLGYKGKLAIHPSHLPIINEIFKPSREEIEEAEEIVKVYEDAASRGLGATTYAGRMIDYLTYKQAKDLLNIARILKNREKKT